MKWIVKLEKVGGSYRLTIPKAVIVKRSMLADRYVLVDDGDNHYIKIASIKDSVYEKNIEE